MSKRKGTIRTESRFHEVEIDERGKNHRVGRTQENDDLRDDENHDSPKTRLPRQHKPEAPLPRTHDKITIT